MERERQKACPTAGRYEGATLSGVRLQPEEVTKIFSWLSGGRSFLVFLGSPGIGKTYFCHALMDYVKEARRFRHMRLWNERSLLSSIRSSMEEQGSDYISAMRLRADDDLIILDDLGSSGVTDWRKEILFEFVDYRYELQKPTVITSNLSEQEIFSNYNARFHSRLFAKENTVLVINGQDLRQEGL